MKNTKEIPECIGPVCDYDARASHCATGLTWKELQAYREYCRRQVLRYKGITDPTVEMLCAKEVPTYNQYFNIKPTPKKDNK